MGEGVVVVTIMLRSALKRKLAMASVVSQPGLLVVSLLFSIANPVHRTFGSWHGMVAWVSSWHQMLILGHVNPVNGEDRERHGSRSSPLASLLAISSPRMTGGPNKALQLI